MSWWPWVSRRAYDTVNAALQREIERNDGLVDHLQRVGRREAGMPEHPRAAPRPEAQEPVEIPDDFEELVMTAQSEGVRVILREQYRIRMANGSTPERLYSELLRQLGEPEEVEA